MPLGWRPADVVERFPVYKIEDVYDFEKYDPKYSPSLLAWCWIQLITLLLFTSYLFANIAIISTPGIFVYGLFIFLMVYAFTDLMDRNRYALFWEVVKNILGCFIIYKTGDWFHADSYSAAINYIITGWFFISTFATGWFVFIEFNPKRNSL